MTNKDLREQIAQCLLKSFTWKGERPTPLEIDMCTDALEALIASTIKEIMPERRQLTREVTSQDGFKAVSDQWVSVGHNECLDQLTQNAKEKGIE